MLPEITLTKTAQELRPYQWDADHYVLDAWDRNKNPLVPMATGLGKSTVLSQLLVDTCDPAKHRALVIAHTQEIIYQLRDRIAAQYNGALDHYYGPSFAPGIGIVMAENDAKNARIVVATRQSVHPKRLAALLEYGAFDYLIIDEGHHSSLHNTYSEILSALRTANPNLKMVGFTATPKRSDKQALGAIYDEMPPKEMSDAWSILGGINAGYLVSPTRIKVQTDVDVSDLKTIEGDYEKKKLISVLDAANWVQLAIDAYNKYGLAAKQTLAFFPEVAMSKLFVRKLCEQGIQAAHLDMSTPKAERGRILAAFLRREIQIISNYGILTEGVDLPLVDVILWCRPTRSETVFTQAIGRCLRPYPGKTSCFIVDLTPNDTRALTLGTLLGRMIACDECGAESYWGIKCCPKCGADLSIAKTKALVTNGGGLPTRFGLKDPGIGLHDEVVSLFANLTAAWHKDSEKEIFTCSLGFKAGALVIAPPSYAGNYHELMVRISKGRTLQTEWATDGVHKLEHLNQVQHQIDRLLREERRIDHYTLWCVSEPDVKTGKVKIEHLRSNTDLASLMLEADREVLARTPGKNMVAKDRAWRDQLASDGQKSMLRALRIKGYADKELTKGQAAELITHHQATRLLIDYIERDKLPAKKE